MARRNNGLIIVGLAILAGLLGGGHAAAQSIPSTPGWYSIPNTNLRNAAPPDYFNGYSAEYRSRVHNIINAWSGGTVDTLRNRLVIWGGGHNDYYGNELYALDLVSLSMRRLTDPSPPNAFGGSCTVETLADGNPNSRHTYAGLAYLEHVDRLFAFSGSLACGAGWPGVDTWTFNFATQTWQNMNPSGPRPRERNGIVSAYDPNTRKVFINSSNGLFTYTFETNSFEFLSDVSNYIDNAMTAVIDPVRKKLVIVGGDPSNNGGFKVYDIGPGSNYTIQNWTTTGGDVIVNSGSPGLAYDPVTDRIIGWSGGNTVYSLNMDTRVWTPITFSGGPGAAPGQGTFGRFGYVPNFGVFVVVNSVDDNGYTLRVSSGTSTPPPPPALDTTPPAASISTPTFNSTVSSSSVVVSANASDNVGVVGVQFKLDGVNIGSEDATAPYSVVWNSTTATNGAHTITAVARDSAGNRTTSSPVSVTVANVTPSPDTTPPTVSLTSPAVATTVSGTLTLAASASDNVGVVGVQFKVDGVNVGSEDTTNPYSSSWDSRTVADGSHVLTAVARDAAGNTATSLSRTITVSNTSGTTVTSATTVTSGSPGQLSIPLKTWIARPLPQRGAGPAPVGSGAKHMRLAHNPVDGRIYFLGGDWSGPDAQQSGRQELYSLGIANGDWRLDYPYCGPAGEVQAGNPDEGGWVYDTKRNLFWWLPGIDQRRDDVCPGGATQLFQTIMTWNPVTKKWANPGAPNPSWVDSFSRLLFGVYDPVKDQIIRFYHDGGVGTSVVFYDIASNTWTRKIFGNDAYIGTSPYYATDFENRIIYLIDGYNSDFYRYRMDSQTLEYIGKTPTASNNDLVHVVWDSVNKVLLWPSLDTSRSWGWDAYITLWIYNPATNQWERDAMVQPEGRPVRGLASVFDPYQNVLIVIGGQLSGGDDPSLTHYFLYRYGSGSGGSTPPPPPPPPSDTTLPTVTITAPAGGTVSGTVTLLATVTDNVGVVGVQFKVDEVNIYAEDTTAPYSGTWDSTGVSNGTHTITAVARDATGNTNTASITVTVSNQVSTPDTTAPSVAITAPGAGVTVSGTSVALSATASDNVGVVGVQFKVDGVNVGAEDTTASYGATWDSATVPNGSHTLTAVARDAAGNQKTATAVTITVANATTPASPIPTPTGQISLSLRTFVARPMPQAGSGAGALEAKHMRLTVNTDNGRIYFSGGDYSGGDAHPQSGRNELWSHSTKDGDWRLEYPYCGPAGEVQPASPDETGWVFDSKRQVFWILPGFYTGQFNEPNRCAGLARQVAGWLTFDPLTRKWKDENVQDVLSVGDENQARGNAVYDPVTDAVIRFANPHDSGAQAVVFYPSTRTFERVDLGVSAHVGNGQYMAIDVNGRAVYVLSLYWNPVGKLLKYDLDKKTATFVSDLPFAGPFPQNIAAGSSPYYQGFGHSVLVFDAVNRKLLWPHDPDFGGPVQLWVYDVDTGRWEQDPMVTQPAGKKVFGNHAVYDPQQNATVFFGGLVRAEQDSFFLYRYGNGTGTPVPPPAPTDTTPPSIVITAPASGATVSGASVTLSATASDNGGVTGVQFKVDGVNIYAEDTTAPYSGTWDSTGVSNGTHTITAAARDAAGNTNTASITVTVSNQSQAADTTSPTVSITSPTSGATMSGTYTLSATATDNVGVVGVQFKVDGVNVGAEDTTAPYSVSWTSTSVADGSHTITAAARDSAGNTKTSMAVTVNVSTSVSNPASTQTSQECPGGRILQGNPGDYLSLVASLQPCDTLALAAGTYDANGLPVDGRNGTASQPITITGPASGPAAVIVGLPNQNTVRIRNSSYVAIKNLEINGRYLGVDPVNGEQPSHHISLENLFIHSCADDQGTVGISTNRAPAWNWIIRNNVITNCGTGMYLGNSDGNQQFLAGVIEHNLIYDTIGYNIEIKHQTPLPTNIPGLPLGTTKTVIRHNVFSKANNASTGDMARPNLLIGYVPLSGPGQDNYYEIYGNFFYQNPTGEPLFQGEGNFALYDNLFFNSVDPSGAYPTVLIQPHKDRPRNVRVFNNTIISKNGGISVSGGYTSFSQKVIGNAVFAASPISAADQQGNITDTYQNAANYLNNPFAPLGSFDLFPRVGQLTGTTLDMSSVNSYENWDRDFNGTQRTGFNFRGAYGGEGTNPGWLPKLERKLPAGSASPQPSDTTPPTVTITAPAGGTVSGTVTLSATASDNVGVVGVQFKVDGVNLYAEDTTAPYSGTWDSTGVSNGTHTITAVARDAAGNTNSASITVTVSNQAADTTPPVVSISSPGSGATVSGTSTLAATATDNVGVVGVQFKVDGVNVGAEDTTAPYSVSWTSTAVANGTHNVTAVARDAAGNTQAATVIVTVSNPVSTPDTTAPAVSITAPGAGVTVSGTSVALSATASDSVGVVAVQFKVDGVNVWAEDTTAPYGVTWDSATVPNGSHTLTAVARDAAGNQKTSASITISVSNLAGPSQATVVGPSDDWCGIVNSATPGDEIVFKPGAYAGTCWLSAVGSPSAPIVMRSQSEEPGQRATFTYSGSTANVLELKDAAYLVIRGFAFGPMHEDVDAVRIVRGRDLVIERNLFTGSGNTAISAYSGDTQRVTVRQNTLRDRQATTMYFGCQDGVSCHATELLIEDNVIDNVTPFDPNAIGYGLQIKLNSYGTVRGNTITRTYGPGVMVYGSNRNDPPSVVERNYIEGSVTEGGVVVGGGPAIVRNNVLVGNAYGGVSAQNYKSRNLQQNIWIVHNTLLDNDDSSINVQGWVSGSGNAIAYNAIAPKAGTPSFYPASPIGTIPGNIICDASCFVHSTSAPYNLHPAFGSPLIDAAGSGSEPWRPVDDFMSMPRGAFADVGAFEQTPAGPTVDTTPPTVAITAPSAGSTVSGTVTVSATAADDSGVTAVQFKVDGVNLGEDTTNDYFVVWDSRTAANGTYLLTAVARDPAGNTTTTSRTVTVLNDTTRPTVSLAAPTDGSTVSGSVSVFVTASDNVKVVGVQFKLDGVNVGAEVTTSPYVATIDTTKVSNGSHTLTAVARDAAGNTATSSVTVTVSNGDTTPPTVVIVGPNNSFTLSGVALISAKVSDNVGVVGVQFKLDGVNLGPEITTNPYSFSWDSRPVSNGRHRLTAVARDAAGNKTSINVTVRVRNR